MNIFLSLFANFFSIGAFTLGGGYAMLSIVEEIVVNKKGWLSKSDFWDMIAVVQSLPGVFAINTALYVGYRIKGLRGGLAAAFGATLPSFIIIVVVAMFFSNLREYEIVENFFRGIRPCVVALILVPSLKMVKESKLTIKTSWIPILATVLICSLGVSPIYIVAAAGVGGILCGLYFHRKTFKN